MSVNASITTAEDPEFGVPTPRPSTSPSMEYARTYSVESDRADKETYTSHVDRVDNSTFGSRLKHSLNSISHCIQTTGWAACCCGCLPCMCLYSACTGKKQMWN
ncbi:hypothetical protein TWF132_010023 [Orbilia oligospora]|uniref:Uncharacterized protein n=1 Tax=Orbilia oligospora TaxID=2813651 RepID=A0A7C8JKQ1_ORBOL|nr:hypothetical protein TWF703_008569 [Orbilia oligospora]KAF3283574.1 hypothetical protein TWF132_010023 [Orbilia oligospora]